MTTDRTEPAELTDVAASEDQAGADQQPAGQPRRPRPGPGSPTSRARRAAAASVQPELRRPSPRPRPAEPTAASTATNEAGVPADERSRSVTLTKQAPVSETDSTDLDGPTGKAQYRVQARSPLWLVAMLVLAILALGGLTGWLATHPDKSGSVSQREQALASAKSAVPLILSYGYQSFDSDVAKAQAQLTGRADTDYVHAMTVTIKPAAAKAKAVVRAQTDGAGVETVSADGKQVTVVVFGEQKVTNTALSSPRIDPFRVRATLDLVGGHWLVSKFDQI